MARKTKKSSCRVEHWWEARGYCKWIMCSSEDVRLVIRHMIERHYLGRPAKVEDLQKFTAKILVKAGLSWGLILVFKTSTFAIIRHAYPEFFDWTIPDHLHQWDFRNQRRIWHGQEGNERAHEAVRHMVEVHHLQKTPSPKDLLSITTEVFKSFHLLGLLLRKFRGSRTLALRHAYPELFDLSRPDHVHEWDTPQQRMWQGKRGAIFARTAIRHMVEIHHLKRQAQPDDLRGITKELLDSLGLGEAVRIFHNSPAAALRHAYPELFDLSRPDHVHEWDTPQQRMWQGKRGAIFARTAIRHMVEAHHLGRPARFEDLRELGINTFQRLGLDGMLVTKFQHSPAVALRHAYPEFAEAIGRRIKGTADFVGVLEAEDSKRAPKLLRDLMRHFGNDLVDVADILAVVYTGRLEAKTAMEILQDPTMRPWIVPFDGRGHGPGKPPIGDDFPFYLLEKDQNGVIAGIIRRRLTEWRRRVLGARPTAKARETFLRQLRELQDKFRANGGKEVAPAA